MRWQSSARFRGLRPVATAPWATLLALGLPGWVLAVSATAAAVVPEHHASTAGQPPLDWLLTDRGPFHRAQEYTDFVERYRQGFTTRYRIYRLICPIRHEATGEGIIGYCRWAGQVTSDGALPAEQEKTLEGIADWRVWVYKRQKLSVYRDLKALTVVAVQSPSRVQLCHLMDCNMPGFPVPHRPLEFTQVHVH